MWFWSRSEDMPSRAPAPPLVAALLAALWVSLGRGEGSEPPGAACDTGKLYLDRDLPQDAVYLECPRYFWPESSQPLSAIDTVYDPEPARQICMDQSISYTHPIPNSGAYRPVMAASGEYLYCPPQRWINNLHHSAVVLLYHPCAPLHERVLLSSLARSCLPDHIVTPHPQLSERTPIALVSWGRTLELSTLASSDVCDWLEAAASTRSSVGGVNRSQRYDLLLTRPAAQQREQRIQGSLRRCCERTLWMEVKGKSRPIRAAIQTDRDTVSRTGEVQRNSSTPSSHSPPGNISLLDPPAAKEAASQSKNRSLTPRPTAAAGSGTSQTLRTLSSGSRRAKPQVQQPGPKHTARTNSSLPAGSGAPPGGVNSKNNQTATPEGPALGQEPSRDQGPEHGTAESAMKDGEAVDVKERELERRPTDAEPGPPGQSDETVSGSQAEQPNTQPAGRVAGDESRAAAINTGLPRTPRSDEAVWAAAALGFLLILLTLSVLHTRLYRHWRTAPSLYWHDPQQDYDSVADVIRRRLRIAKTRRKRGRRQECVLLPSSSSSDEHP